MPSSFFLRAMIIARRNFDLNITPHLWGSDGYDRFKRKINGVLWCGYGGQII